jgi:hypothetical protein
MENFTKPNNQKKLNFFFHVHETSEGLVLEPQRDPQLPTAENKYTNTRVHTYTEQTSQLGHPYNEILQLMFSLFLYDIDTMLMEQ